MKEFFCGAVVPGCAAVYRASDDNGILAQVAVHAREAHGIETVTPELVATVRSHIHDV